MNTTQSIERVDIPMHAARVCDAIARIGYQAPAAIMDIVDNAVTAGASRIKIKIILKEEATLGSKNNIDKIAIIDNGCGMSESQVRDALSLGSPANYGKNSLSKYGMGLKSAGFSLGNRISILSRQNGKNTRVFVVDKSAIALDGNYHATATKPDDESMALLNIQANENGTLILLSGCDRPGQDSAKKTIDKLTSEMGVTYYEFLKRPENPLQVSILVSDRQEILIQPRDILFSAEAYPTFDKDNYDCKRPVRVLDTSIPVDASNPASEKIRLEIVLFPQQRVSACPAFTSEERERIKAYDVSRNNKGFFIYRNNRLIRWGDDLDGLVGKDDIIIRGRISLTTSHDDSLHVDVSKQRLFIPEDVRTAINAHLILPFRYAQEIMYLCGNLLRQDEGEKFNEKNKQLGIEEDDEIQGEVVKKEIKKRRGVLVNKSKQTLDAAGETPVVPDVAVVATELPIFEKIRYSDKVNSLVLWEMGEDQLEGVFVRINKNHSYYQTVLANFAENSAARQAIEALIWCAAVGENKAITTLTKLEAAVVDEVLGKFKKTLAVNLDSWSGKNQDLFDE